MADTKFMSFAEVTPVGTDSVLVGNSTNGVRRAQLSKLKAAIGDIVEESLGANGYIKYANGLIVQWGSNLFETSPTTVNLPTSFPNASYKLATAVIDSANDVQSTIQIKNKTNASFIINGWRNGSISARNMLSVDWIAIGF